MLFYSMTFGYGSANTNSVPVVAGVEDPIVDDTFALWTVPQLKSYLRGHEARLEGIYGQLM